MARKKPAQPNQSLQHGIACLQMLVAEGRPIGSRELSRMMNMEHTRTNRLLGTLAYLELAERTPDKKYVPGPGVHVLAAMSMKGSHLMTMALPVIRDLIEETGETVALGVLWQDKICYLYHGGPNRDIVASLGGHDLMLAERSSIGLILLSLRENDEVLEAFSLRDDFDKKTLMASVRKTRRDGFGIGEDGCSIAVAVGDPAMAGLALAAPDGDRLPKWLPRLKQAADTIAERTRAALLQR